MAGYKDEEIEASVSRFVQSTIRIEKDALGPVDMGSKFNEVLQLISSTLVYDPNAIFYVIFLASNKLNTLVETSIEYMDDILEAIDEMSYSTKDISRTTLLGDAAAALLTVDQILTDKSAISSRAFTRYKEAVDGFTVVSLEPNIRKAGQIVRTPQQARSEILTAVSNMSDAWEEILEVLAQIKLMLAEFNDLNLGVLSIQDSVRKVRQDLQTLQDAFEDTATTRDDKIALCRSAYLNLASGKSVLNNFTTVSDPSDPRLISSASVVGRPEVPLGDEGELTPASVECTKSAPWEYSGTANQLKLREDGGSEKTYTFAPVAYPSVISNLDDNWDFSFGTPDAYNIQAGVNDRLEVDGLPPIPLTAGTNRTALNIVTDINTWSGSGTTYPYVAGVTILNGLNFVKIIKQVDGATEIRMTAEDVTFRDRILAAYVEIGFFEGQADTATGLSAAEAVEKLTIAGDVKAEVVREIFEDDGDGNGLVISTTQATFPINTFSAYGHEGDMLVVRRGLNAGYHRIVNILISWPNDVVTVESTTPFKEVGDILDSWVLLDERLRLTSKATDLTTEIEITSGNINSVMGFTPGVHVGATTGFRAAENGTDVDFTIRDVVAGDIIRLADPTPVATEHVVLELSGNNRQLEIDPPLPTDITVASFRILSAAAVAYEDFELALEEWYGELAASKYTEDILELERVINPLVANSNPSHAQINDARGRAEALRVLLTNDSPPGLTEVLTAFQVDIVPRIDAALKMLVERGMDRAYDLLMDGQISTFFGMDKDDASSSSFMLKSMRSVVQSDLPLSKLDDDADDIIHEDLVEDTDADYDFSDADEDENVRLLGEVPDFESDDDESAVRNVRY